MNRFLSPTKPLVVGTLTGEKNLALQIKKAAHPTIDIIEIRLDTFPWITHPFPSALSRSKKLLQKINKSIHKPLLLTLRSYTESGRVVPKRRQLNDEQRAELLKPLLSQIRFVDLEIRRFSFAKKLTVQAHKNGVCVIHSYHEFSRKFQERACEKWAQKSKTIGGNIFKVAMNPSDNTDLEKFMAWGSRLSNPARVLIGMGKKGFPSRVLGFGFGSIMTYGHLGTSAAPGQMPAAELGRIIGELYGRR